MKKIYPVPISQIAPLFGHGFAPVVVDDNNEDDFARFELWRRDPFLWAEERLGADRNTWHWSRRPEYSNGEGHVWDGDVDPLASAWQNLADGNWAALMSATGTGKTHLLAHVCLWFLDCWPDSLIVTAAPKAEQLKVNLWKEIGSLFGKLRRIRPHARLTSLKLLADGRLAEGNAPEDGDSFAGWQIIGFSTQVSAGEAANVKGQGLHRAHMLIVCDETPGIAHSVMTTFEQTSVGEHNLIFAVGNPDHSTDGLAMFSRNADVVARRISAYDHPNVVCGRDVIPGAVTQKSIDRRREKLGEENPIFVSRVRGIVPEQAVDALIKLRWIMQACPWSKEWREYEQREGHPIAFVDGYGAVGVDVAQSQTGDRAAVAYGFGNKLTELSAFQCPNATHLAYNLLGKEVAGMYRYPIKTVFEQKVHPSLCGIDAAGVGVATFNAMHEAGYKAIAIQNTIHKESIPEDAEGKPLYGFKSLRAQMYFALREDLQMGRVIFDISDRQLISDLADELTKPTFQQTGGTIQVEDKAKIKQKLGGKSPDLADAVVYWNWVRSGRYLTSAGFFALRG